MSHWIPRRRGTVRPPGPDQSFDSGYWFGGLQSLAAARAEHCSIGFRGAEGPGALAGLNHTPDTTAGKLIFGGLLFVN